MTVWKYDTDPRDPLAGLRIPSTSKWPLSGYIAAFHRDSPHRPTTAESRMIASYIEEHLDRHFATWEREEMARKPFDVYPGRNTVIFHKYDTGSWGYRRRSWQVGSPFSPAPRMVGVTLEEAMDLTHWSTSNAPDPEWTDWKTGHPEVFPA